MADFKRSWIRFRHLPDDVLDELPEHVRAAFASARAQNFEIEMLCPGVRVPPEKRAPRRFVLVADDLEEHALGGPLQFDLSAVVEDVRKAHRAFVISSAPAVDIYAMAYAAGVEDLSEGHDVSLIIETRPPFARAWARTLAALQTGTWLGTTPATYAAAQGTARRIRAPKPARVR